MVEISREERDAYLIPQNFVDTGTILGGTVKLRNAVEAAVLAVGSAIPLFYLPMAFNIRLMIVIAVSVPLGVFGVVGIGGDSLTQFVAHWFRFMKRRRIVTPTPQGNLEANRHRHLRLISKRYRVVYYDDSDTLPHNAQVLQRKADRHGKLVKRQTLYDLLPIEKIENGILHTTDDRYIKILEIEPINFLLRSPREQRSVIYSFASLLKVSPVRLQFKSFSRKADVNAYLDKLRRDAANEPDAAVRKRHMSYIRFVKRLGSRDAVSRRFFVIFQYEAPTNERNISYAEIVSTLETTARNFRTYLAQCGNAIVEHENEDEFITDVFYTLLNRRTAVQVPLQERIQDVLASYAHHKLMRADLLDYLTSFPVFIVGSPSPLRLGYDLLVTFWAAQNIVVFGPFYYRKLLAIGAVHLCFDSAVIVVIEQIVRHYVLICPALQVGGRLWHTAHFVQNYSIPLVAADFCLLVTNILLVPIQFPQNFRGITFCSDIPGNRMASSLFIKHAGLQKISHVIVC